MEHPEVGSGEDLIDLSGLSLHELESVDCSVLADAVRRLLAADQADISGFDAYIRPPVGSGSSDCAQERNHP